MKTFAYARSFFAMAMVWTLVVLPLAAQTRVTMPKNKYKVEDDVKLGQKASNEVHQQFPLLNDQQAERYIEAVGARLVAAIPPEFNQPAFNYQFDVVNASDINAFALPGGPMFVNRGMIEAAKNEGEMAGVMAHEISHVALRHSTAQQTKLSNPMNQILGIGAVVGGGLLGGQTGAQAGQMVAQGLFTKYSRDYETQADILGSRIMANAGYDPRDLANMFQTIEQQSGGGKAPEWLSSHPNPGNRYQKINAEAAALTISGTPRKITPEFQRIRERFRSMPRAKSMAEIQRDVERGIRPNNSPDAGNGSTSGSAVSAGRYSASVGLPSTRMRAYSNSALTAQVPDNWEELPTNGQVWFAPEGAYGNEGITHGVMIGAAKGDGSALGEITGRYLNQLLQANSYLKQVGQQQRVTVAGLNGLGTRLIGVSPVTGQNEIVTIYTAQLRTGDLFYVAAVSPESEAARYNPAFRSIISSIRFNN